MKNLALIAMAFLVNISILAQTSLSEGDIAFVAINSDGNTDDFSFLLLKDIESNTAINFTDNGWTSLGSFNSLYPETHIEWKSTEALYAGKVIQIKTHNGTAVPTSSSGIISGDEMTISVAGDQIIAYQGIQTAPSFIAAISFNKNDNLVPGDNFDGDSYSNSTTALPTDLTMGYSALHVVNVSTYKESDNAIYNCSTMQGSKAVLLNEINNYLNWQTNNTNPFSQYPFTNTFTVDLSTGIEKNIIDNLVKIYPNPASNLIYLSIPYNDTYIIKIINQNGIVVKEIKFDSDQNEPINIQKLNSGIYIVKGLSEKYNFVEKLIVQ